MKANRRPCAFKSYSKVRRRFQGSCYPEAKKKDFSGEFRTEFVRSTMRDSAFLSYVFRTSAFNRMHNSRCLFRSCRYFAVHCGVLHRFAFPSVWPLLYFANSRLFPPFSCFSVLSFILPPPRFHPSATVPSDPHFFPTRGISASG